MSEHGETAKLPSDLLPKGIFSALGSAWDWVTELGARPARWIGLNERYEGWARGIPYTPFALLLLPAVVGIEWVQAIEGIRQSILHALPEPLRFAVQQPAVALAYLATAFVLILSINREWSINEKAREQHAALLEYGENDTLADLRYVGIISGLLLILVLPLGLRSLNAVACGSENGCLYSNVESVSAWFWYCARAILPNGYLPSEGVVELTAWSAYPKYVLWPSLNAVLIFGLFEVARLSKVSELAIDSLRRSSDRAVAVGERILPRLRRIIAYDDQEKLEVDFYKNAAIAMGRIGSPTVFPMLMRLATHDKAHVRNRAIQALQALREKVGPQSKLGIEIEKFLQGRFRVEQSTLVKGSIESALAIKSD